MKGEILFAHPSRLHPSQSWVTLPTSHISPCFIGRTTCGKPSPTSETLHFPHLRTSSSANALRSLAANWKCQFTQMAALPSHSWKWMLASPGLWQWWPCHLGQVLTRREKEGAPPQIPPGLVRLGAGSPVRQVGSGWPGWLGVGSVRGQVQGLAGWPPVLSELALGYGTWEMARGF